MNNHEPAFMTFAIPRGQRSAIAALMLGLMMVATVTPAMAEYKQELHNDMRRCTAGSGPAILVTVDGVKSASGNVRVQSYRGTSEDWLQKGRWLARVQLPARAGTMTFCMPVPSAGRYAIAVRHDVNGNGETDISTDGGAMSNNPSINIFNLGRPSVGKTAFEVGSSVKSIRVQMRYL
jgi:uncharacterized protein (DUF2141 family)